MGETISYSHGVSDLPLLGQTLGDNLEGAAIRYSHHEAVVSRHQRVRLTYRELNDTVNEVAKGLLAAGLQKGDRLGIWAPNCVEWLLVQYATAKIGVILVNINPAYRLNELKFVLEQSECRVLVAARSFKQSNYEQMVEEVRGSLPALELIVYLDSTGWEKLLADGRHISLDDLLERSSLLEFDDPINIQYTSGTTGFPKGATLSHHNILNNGFFVGELCRYTEKDRVCIPVPFYHCFGMVLGNIACLTHGSCTVVPDASFEPLSVLKTIEAEQCTSLYGVPTMFIAELEHPDFNRFDLSTLRTGIMAGSPCPIGVLRKVVSLMHMQEVTICYGMTETSPVSTQTGPDDGLEQRVSTVGRVHPHVEIKIVDPDTGRSVPRGTRGELLTRGYSVMIGYWDDKERTSEAIDDSRWMHTGDLATMDEEGYVRIVGRIKDMIIRGGENVYPREIEEFLHTHPDVSDVQVVGVSDKHYGEQVVAWVQLRPNAVVTEEEIRQYCKGQVAHFKVPRYVFFVEEFPMTVTGKIQKFKLREAAEAKIQSSAIPQLVSSDGPNIENGSS